MSIRVTIQKLGKSMRRFWKLGLFVVLLGFFMARAVAPSASRVGTGPVPIEPGDPLSADTVLYTARTEQVTGWTAVIGTAASQRNIQLSARIVADVQEVLVSAGDAVTNGQLLIVLDAREIEKEYRAAQARFLEAQQEYDRNLKLWERNATTEKALNAASSIHSTSQARLDQIEVMRTYTRIHSPVDGIVSDRQIQAGDLASPGTPLLTVYDPSVMRMEVPVPVRLVDRIQLQSQLVIELDRPSGTYTGVVSEIVSQVDPSSRTQTVKVHFQTVKAAILPGTFGRVRVPSDPRPAIMVPVSAVYRLGQLEMVQCVSGDRGIQRMVTTGPVRDGRVEVLSGLQDGDVIVARPNLDVRLSKVGEPR